MTSRGGGGELFQKGNRNTNNHRPLVENQNRKKNKKWAVDNKSADQRKYRLFKSNMNWDGDHQSMGTRKGPEGRKGGEIGLNQRGPSDCLTGDWEAEP